MAVEIKIKLNELMDSALKTLLRRLDKTNHTLYYSMETGHYLVKDNRLNTTLTMISPYELDEKLNNFINNWERLNLIKAPGMTKYNGRFKRKKI